MANNQGGKALVWIVLAKAVCCGALLLVVTGTVSSVGATHTTKGARW